MRKGGIFSVVVIIVGLVIILSVIKYEGISGLATGDADLFAGAPDSADTDSGDRDSDFRRSGDSTGEDGDFEDDFGEETGNKENNKFIDSDGRIRRVDIEVKEPEDGFESKLEVKGSGESIEINSEVALEIFSKIIGSETNIEVEATMSDGSKRNIEVLPEDIFEITKKELNTDRANIELREESYAGVPRAIYHVELMERGKVLGVWSTSIDTRVVIDSETGEVLFANKGPWWKPFIVGRTHVGEVIVFPVN